MDGWMLSYKNPDPERMFSRTYLKEETAYKDAADDIKGWAKDDLEDLAADGGDEGEEHDETHKERIKLLREVLRLIKQKKYKEAYEEWREYADDAEPREDVIIEDTQIVDE